MTSPITELQAAVYERLVTDTALLDIVPINLSADEKERRLYDYIPEDALSPYIHFDAPYVSKVYVKPQEVVDITFTLHMWHNQQQTGQFGIYVIASILQAVKDALRYRLPIQHYKVMKVTIDTERIFDDANVEVKHAVLIYTYKLMKI